MSLSVIGYLPNSHIQLHWELRSLHWRELPGVKITLKNLLNMCYFQDACIVSPQSNARCYFFFLWCFGGKNSYFLGEDKIRWLVWLFGKMHIVNKQTESHWRLTKQEVGRDQILPS